MEALPPITGPLAARSGGFRADETHRIALQPNNRLLAHSDGAGWRNLYVSIAAEAPWRGTLDPVGHLALAYCLGRSAPVSRIVEGDARAQRTVLRPRLFGSIPGDARSDWRIDGSFDIALVYLRGGMLRAVAGEAFDLDPDRVEINLPLGFTDPLLEQIVLAVVERVRDPAALDGPYVDHLATMAAAHLLRHHATKPARGASPFTPPRAPVSRRVDGGIFRVLDYIDANLEGDLSLDALAREAGTTEARFAVRFAAAHGETPHQFIMRRRVERARMLLSGSDLPIAEIALRTGFSSQSHLSEVFRRAVGEAPGAFRRGGARKT